MLEQYNKYLGDLYVLKQKGATQNARAVYDQLKRCIRDNQPDPALDGMLSGADAGQKLALLKRASIIMDSPSIGPISSNLLLSEKDLEVQQMDAYFIRNIQASFSRGGKDNFVSKFDKANLQASESIKIAFSPVGDRDTIQYAIINKKFLGRDLYTHIAKLAQSQTLQVLPLAIEPDPSSGELLVTGCGAPPQTNTGLTDSRTGKEIFKYTPELQASSDRYAQWRLQQEICDKINTLAKPEKFDLVKERTVTSMLIAIEKDPTLKDSVFPGVTNPDVMRERLHIELDKRDLNAAMSGQETNGEILYNVNEDFQSQLHGPEDKLLSSFANYSLQKQLAEDLTNDLSEEYTPLNRCSGRAVNPPYQLKGAYGRALYELESRDVNGSRVSPMGVGVVPMADPYQIPVTLSNKNVLIINSDQEQMLDIRTHEHARKLVQETLAMNAKLLGAQTLQEAYPERAGDFPEQPHAIAMKGYIEEVGQHLASRGEEPTVLTINRDFSGVAKEHVKTERKNCARIAETCYAPGMSPSALADARHKSLVDTVQGVHSTMGKASSHLEDAFGTIEGTHVFSG